MQDANNTVPEIKFFPDTTGTEIIYRTGDAPAIIDPEKIEITGDIKTVGTFLKSRYVGKMAAGLQTVDPGKAVVFVNKEKLIISLVLDPENRFGAKVAGMLSRSTELAEFGINTGKIFNRDAFIKLLKFNAIYFTDKTAHEKVLAAIRKHSSTVTYNRNDDTDERGNKDESFKRTVTTTIPPDFVLDMPIFKGFSTETFRVDVCIDVKAGQLEFWLESVMLHELMETAVDIIFNEELKPAAGLVIIYK